ILLVTQFLERNLGTYLHQQVLRVFFPHAILGTPDVPHFFLQAIAALVSILIFQTLRVACVGIKHIALSIEIAGQNYWPFHVLYFHSPPSLKVAVRLNSGCNSDRSALHAFGSASCICLDIFVETLTRSWLHPAFAG